MKKLEYAIFSLVLIIILMAASCLEASLPSSPPGYEGTTEGLGGGRRPVTLTEYEPFDVIPLTVEIPGDFMRGVDISNCYIIEQAGGVYYDAGNNERDIIEILSDAGVNWVRLRLWHNHKLAANPGPYAGDGDNDLVKTRAIAKRAKEAGMKFLLNLHYSDNWADPGRQQIPAAWAGYTVDQLVDAVYDYTFDTILELKAAGAEPDMVQIGNEIWSGLLSPTIGAGQGGNWVTTTRALRAGSQAVRLAAPNAKIMIHFDRGGDVSGCQERYDRFRSGDTYVDYDVAGLSWYPYYSSHSTINNLYANISNIKSRYNKEVVVVETGYAWITEYDGDEQPNLFHHTQENSSARQMSVDMSQSNAAFSAFTINSGVISDTREDGTRYIVSSPENQARLFSAVFDATVGAGGSGVFWWAADWIPYPGLRSNWDNQTLFDFDGKALPALAVMGITGTEQ